MRVTQNPEILGEPTERRYRLRHPRGRGVTELSHPCRFVLMHFAVLPIAALRHQFDYTIQWPEPRSVHFAAASWNQDDLAAGDAT
jgi:hypothetical protein